MAKIYFKNLNGFRFIAAASVVITHIELFKRRAGLDNIWANPFIFEMGSAGVDFFFVLSGFLITFLLLKEKQERGSVNIRNFYVRRILRIWPLYYTVILFCFWVVPNLNLFFFEPYSVILHQNYEAKFLFSLLMMPNVALCVFGDMPYAAQAWSIGVEEQFYLIWPFLVNKAKYLFQTIVVFILLFIGFKVAFLLINRIFPFDEGTFTRIKDLLVATRMECMGIGGAGAYLYHRKYKVVKFFSSNTVGIISLLLLPFALYFAKALFETHHIILSVLFLAIIINAATSAHTFINLENSVFYYLGNISYGIYLLHPICIGIILKLLIMLGISNGDKTLFNTLLYLFSFAGSIGLASVSYTFFEKKFLNYKSKFAIVVSGDDARDKHK